MDSFKLNNKLTYNGKFFIGSIDEYELLQTDNLIDFAGYFKYITELFGTITWTTEPTKHVKLSKLSFYVPVGQSNERFSEKQVHKMINKINKKYKL